MGKVCAVRTLVAYLNSTVNGVVTGDPAGDKTDFMVWTSPESVESGSLLLLEIMRTVDTILLGRATYEDLVRKWPLVAEWPEPGDVGVRLGEAVNSARKLVVTSKRPEGGFPWGDFAPAEPLGEGDVADQVRDLKNGDGGDIIIFGSPTLVRSLTDARLIDEYKLAVRPVIVPVGERLFDGVRDRTDLELVQMQPQDDGSFVVTYRPA